jgi:hypothetical protein
MVLNPILKALIGGLIWEIYVIFNQIKTPKEKETEEKLEEKV